MATMRNFYCPKCDFEILAEDDFHYGTRIAQFVYFKCSHCKGISSKLVPRWADFTMMTPQYERTMMEIKKIEREDRCDKCGKKGGLSLWAPRFGCPKCRSKLLTDGVEIDVD